ncbi:MAG: hypothetical protein A3G41_08710 [Elusimicrobia bacterium RIFCSPLOWO2_12_FULL_59_9]|nr:MAG: hypothetical protein A3G41_08710 [Elusimicrobia bacterium RIFCSPLOWO2_12_FULL_59_9]
MAAFFKDKKDAEKEKKRALPWLWIVFGTLSAVVLWIGLTGNIGRLLDGSLFFRFSSSKETSSGTSAGQAASLAAEFKKAAERGALDEVGIKISRTAGFDLGASAGMGESAASSKNSIGMLRHNRGWFADSGEQARVGDYKTDKSKAEGVFIDDKSARDPGNKIAAELGGAGAGSVGYAVPDEGLFNGPIGAEDAGSVEARRIAGMAQKAGGSVVELKGPRPPRAVRGEIRKVSRRRVPDSALKGAQGFDKPNLDTAFRSLGYADATTNLAKYEDTKEVAATESSDYANGTGLGQDVLKTRGDVAMPPDTQTLSRTITDGLDDTTDDMLECTQELGRNQDTIVAKGNEKIERQQEAAQLRADAAELRALASAANNWCDGNCQYWQGPGRLSTCARKRDEAHDQNREAGRKEAEAVDKDEEADRLGQEVDGLQAEVDAACER